MCLDMGQRQESEGGGASRGVMPRGLHFYTEGNGKGWKRLSLSPLDWSSLTLMDCPHLFFWGQEPGYVAWGGRARDMVRSHQRRIQKRGVPVSRETSSTSVLLEGSRFPKQSPINKSSAWVCFQSLMTALIQRQKQWPYCTALVPNASKEALQNVASKPPERLQEQKQFMPLSLRLPVEGDNKPNSVVYPSQALDKPSHIHIQFCCLSADAQHLGN